MKISVIFRKGITILLGSAMLAGMMTGMSTLAAQAEETLFEKKMGNTSLGTVGIKSPLVANSNSTGWIGDFVYFGSKDGQTPVKYRVLEKEDDGLLLDCNEVFEKAAYGKTGSGTDLIKNINGPLFYNKYLNKVEQAAIKKQGNNAVFLIFDKLRLKNDSSLDYEILCDYGYSYYGTDTYVPAPATLKKTGDWWGGAKASSYYYIDANGQVETATDVGETHGISPAFYVKQDHILFSTVLKTVADETKRNEYKLTLLDSDLTMSVPTPEEGFLRISGTDGTVTVPYEVTGADRSKVTDVSVLVTEGEYGKTDCSLRYYGTAEKHENGTVSFSWDDSWTAKYKEGTYKIYLIAEVRNSGKSTDYASRPVKLPPVRREISSVGLTFTAPFEDGKTYENEITQTAADMSTLTVASVNKGASGNITDSKDAVTTKLAKVISTEEENATGKEPAKFNTNYTAEFQLNLNKEEKWYVFDASGVKATVAVNGQSVEINTAAEAGFMTTDGSGLRFTTRKAKLLKVKAPLNEEGATAIQVTYTSSYDDVKEQLHTKCETATVLAEGQQEVAVPIAWGEAHASFQKEIVEKKTFDAWGKIEPAQADLDGEEQTVWTKVTMEAQRQVAAPTVVEIDQKVTDIKSDFVIHLISETEGTRIYYTLDGSEPTTGSMAYDADTGILIEGPKEAATSNTDSKTVELKIIAVKDDWADSEVMEIIYRFAPRYKLQLSKNGTGDQGYIVGVSADGKEIASYTPEQHVTEGIYAEGVIVTVQAPEKEGYTFQYWYDYGNNPRSSNVYTMTSVLTQTLTPVYAENPSLKLTVTDATEESTGVYQTAEESSYSISCSDNRDQTALTNPKYQWQRRKEGSEDWEAMAETGHSWRKTASYEDSGYQYQCKVTYRIIDGGDRTVTFESPIITIHVSRKLTEPVFTADLPTTTEVTDGGQAELKVKVGLPTGQEDDYQITYEWQTSKDGTEYTTIPGESKDTYTITSAGIDLNGYYYRCVVKAVFDNKETALVSQSTVLKVKKDGAGLHITEQPESRTITAGKAVTFTVGAEKAYEEDTLTYQWQISTDGDTYTDIEGQTESSYTIAAASKNLNKNKYRCVVTEKKDEDEIASVISEAAILTVTDEPKEDDYKIAIISQPVNTSVPAGGTATFKVEAQSAHDMVYEWKADYNDGKGFQTVGAGPEYTIQNVVYSLNGARYQCTVTLKEKKEIAVTSSIAVLTVESASYAIKVNHGTASASSSKAGETITIKADEAPDGQEFQKWMINSGRADLADAMKAETSFTMPSGDVELTAVYQEKLAVPKITKQPENVTVQAGSSARFKVEVTGAELSYQWKVDKTDGEGYSDIAGAVSPGYTVYTEDGSMNGYKYVCEISNRSGSVQSNAAMLTVEYKITEGARSTWMRSSDGGMMFRGSGEYDKFRYVKVDGDRISGSNYTKKSGSTIITLSAKYLEKLSNGEHKLTIIWTDGTAETFFTIAGTSSAAASATTAVSSAAASTATTVPSAVQGRDTAPEVKRKTTTSEEQTVTEHQEEPSVNNQDEIPVISGSGKTPENDTVESETTTEVAADENQSVISMDAVETDVSASMLNKYAAVVAIAIILCSMTGIILLWIGYRRRNR